MFKALLFKNLAFLLLLVLSSFYFFKLSQPNQLYWDETLHVEGAKSILHHQKPYTYEILNAHPPLGKETLVLSMKLFGDSPWGARVLSAVAASGCLFFTFLIIFKLSRSVLLSIFSVLVLFFDPLFYVQARIGMLDMFVVFSFLLSFFIFLKLREKPEKVFYYWIFGFSLAYGLIVKSLLLIYYPLFAFYLFQAFREKNLPRNHFIHLFLVTFFAPFVLIYLSYAYLDYSLSQAWEHLSWGLNFLKNHYPAEEILSRWTDWIFVQKPMWYLYQPEGDGIRVVYLTGNFIFWMVIELLFLLALFVNKLRPQYFWFMFLGVILQFLFWTMKPATHFYYMITVIPLYALFIALFLQNLLKLYPEQKGGIVLNASVLVILGILIFIHYYSLMTGKVLPLQQIQNLLQFKQFFFFGG